MTGVPLRPIPLFGEHCILVLGDVPPVFRRLDMHTENRTDVVQDEYTVLSKKGIWGSVVLPSMPRLTLGGGVTVLQ